MVGTLCSKLARATWRDLVSQPKPNFKVQPTSNSNNNQTSKQYLRLQNQPTNQITPFQCKAGHRRKNKGKVEEGVKEEEEGRGGGVGRKGGVMRRGGMRGGGGRGGVKKVV